MWNIDNYSSTINYLMWWKDFEFKSQSKSKEFPFKNMVLRSTENMLHNLQIMRDDITPTIVFKAIKNKTGKMRKEIFYEYLIPKKYPNLPSTTLRDIDNKCRRSFERNKEYWAKIFKEIDCLWTNGLDYLFVENSTGYL